MFICHNKRFSGAIRFGGCAVILVLPLLGFVSLSTYMFLDEPLVSAVQEGNLAEVEALLNRGASANAHSKFRSTMEAVRELDEVDHKEEIMRLLVKHGASDVTSTDLAFLEAAQHKKQPSAEEQNRHYVQLIRGYRQWTKVNPTPVRMEPQAATACANPRPNQEPSPHLQKYLTVFVNSVGRQAMTRQKAPKFPAGTVIVKEKLSALNSRAPELMTVMYKHPKGYNSDVSDWEFLVYDATGTKVESRGDLEKCQNCHEQSPANSADYVFRDYYLPEKQMAALK